MSKLAQKPEIETEKESESSGPNLIVLYALLALGILAAMAFAALVIWPFYKSR